MPDWFNNLKDILECLSYIVTTAGIIAIAISIKEFNKNSERERMQDEQLLIQNSIDVLRKFAEEIIPRIEEVYNKLGAEEEKQKAEVLKQINANLPKNRQLTNLPHNPELEKQIDFISKSKCNYGNIFNQLEQVSVYMNYDMVKEDLVYLPIHKVFIRFVSENIDYLNQLRSVDAPYANVITLYHSWSDKNKIEKLERKRKQVEEELKKIKND